MCFNDDFDMDGLDGPDDDFQEDVFEEEFEPEIDELEMEAEDPATPEFEPPESVMDFQDVFVIGGMIVGLAYEETLDAKEQRDKKGNDDGGD